MPMVTNVGAGTSRLRGLLVGVIGFVLIGDAFALAAYDDTVGRASVPLAEAAMSRPEATPPSTQPSSSVPSMTETGRAAGASRAAPAPTTTTTTVPVTVPPPPPPESGYRYELTVTPTCAAVGDTMTLTMRLKPQGGGVLLVVYSVAAYRTTHAATAGPDGLITHTWTAPPAPGETYVITQAQDPETEKTGRTDATFRILAPGESC